MRALRLLSRILLGIVASLLVLVTLAVAFLGVAEACVDNWARVLPSYAREDISETVQKAEWTDEDYDLLYHQTGLGRKALDALKEDRERIFEFQDALFYEGTLEHEMAAFTTPHDMLADYEAPIAPLEEGDVLVSSSCHTFGWRNGHAAIVTSGAGNGTILESTAPGFKSVTSSTLWFREAANFLVLRLKDKTLEERKEIANWAATHLINVDYSVLTGFFSSPKDQGDDPQTTNCSHLVWQAFYHFGYDIDPDGGIVCTARDIANSKYFEIVQVYGFDPDKLW